MESDDLTRRLERLPASVVHDALRAQGDEIHVEGPDSFRALQKRELEKWKNVIEKAGIVLN